MNSWTDLSDPAARSLLAGYFARVDRLLAPLPQAAAREVRAELESHLLEALGAADANAATARAAMDNLGEPEDFLPALVADRLRERAGRTLNPGHVLAALARSGAAGLAGVIVSILVGLGYVIATACIVLGVLKLISPDGVGVYRLETGELFIGADDKIRGVDLLGIWFSPLAIAAGLVLYVALTWAFGRARARKRTPTGRDPNTDD